jgi:ketosteroid isomerase-like protein
MVKGGTTMSNQPPETVIERFSQLLAEGDLDAMVELYEPDATFAPQPGESVMDVMRFDRR